jgi:cytochrome c
MKPRHGCTWIPGPGMILLYFALILAAYTLLQYSKSPDKNLTAVKPSKKFVDLPMKRGKQSQSMDLVALFTSNPQVVKKGQNLYQAGACTACHGSNGKGDGPAGAFLKPPPRNFHSLSDWTNGTRIADIFKTLQEGIPSKGMPAADTLPAADRFALIHYIRSLNPGYPKPTEEERGELNRKYKLSQGEKEPHQIPVLRAMNLLAKEGEDFANAVKDHVSRIRKDAGSGIYGAALFLKASVNLHGAVNILLRDNSWKQGLSKLREIVAANASPVAFGTKMLTDSGQGWPRMHRYLIKLLDQNHPSTTTMSPVRSIQKRGPAPTIVVSRLIKQGIKSEALFKKYNCAACHNENFKLVGPSFKMLAERYSTDKSTLSQLVAKVKAGGQGNWGPIPMIPHPHISESDIRNIIRYMLSSSGS